ncbi:protoheme IX farnesyltransferase [Rhodopirellula sp. JC740]|uniref:Protoheme IX farnesyltransferase n=1 Tax=Rhodopirellula halodulae TaxID=2894198 RepID=A0ABS8NGH5_9BACT|nr:protoheme IX farnesyltransferase [Rhodopirellula sp. JC740]MCC9642646.1 protoheme IX farnesyltransferase [Rhodopirellula sp. JC740]
MASDCRETLEMVAGNGLSLDGSFSTAVLEPSSRVKPSSQSRPSTDRVSPLNDEIPVSNPVVAADEPAASTGKPRSRTERGWMSDVVELTKPRIVTMILVTTVASALIAGSATLSLVDWFWLMIGTGLIAGSAGAANQVWESVIDLRMPRTANRPVPGGRLSRGLAIAITGSMGIAGAAMLWLGNGMVPAGVGIATWLLYVLVYTPMKTRTSWNTTVGAIAGALPVFMGYTAAGGSLTDIPGWMLFGVLACWQYPHFMAIAWLYRTQYANAGFQMTTTVEPTGRHAAWQSIAGSLALAFCGVVMAWFPAGELVVSIASVAATVLILAASWPLLRASLNFRATPNDQTARKMMRWSLVVLPAVLLVMTLRAAL